MDTQSSDPTRIHDEPKMDLTQSTQAPLVKDDIIKIIRDYNKSDGFTDRKLTDTPTDALAVVNRKYVTLNGPSSGRPTSSVIGQQYFDTNLASGRGKPIYWNGTGFVDSTGTYT